MAPLILTNIIPPISVIRCTVCSDIGPDATIMDERMLDKIKSSGAEVHNEELNPPRQFTMAATNLDGSPTNIICEQAATVDASYAASQMVAEPLLGRPLLDGLGLD